MSGKILLVVSRAAPNWGGRAWPLCSDRQSGQSVTESTMPEFGRGHLCLLDDWTLWGGAWFPWWWDARFSLMWPLGKVKIEAKFQKIFTGEFWQITLRQICERKYWQAWKNMLAYDHEWIWVTAADSITQFCSTEANRKGKQCASSVGVRQDIERKW